MSQRGSLSPARAARSKSTRAGLRRSAFELRRFDLRRTLRPCLASQTA
jgi:hypothetical protein